MHFSGFFLKVCFDPCVFIIYTLGDWKDHETTALLLVHAEWHDKVEAQKGRNAFYSKKLKELGIHRDNNSIRKKVSTIIWRVIMSCQL